MKQVFLITAIAAIGFCSCGQDMPASKVPSVVQNTVETRFANATKIEWEKKNGVYEAEFNLDSAEYTVQIDPAGKIEAYKIDISENQLPASIVAAINNNYQGYKVDDAERLEKDGTTYYQVELEGKTKKDQQLIFTADGNKAENISYMN
jgi:uncharacterized membrane protein YkoI